MRITFTAVLIAGITLSCTGGLTHAATVYQWTAEDGTVHFSDVPPAGADTQVTREIEFEEFEAVDPESAGYSIIDQARDMVEMRSALAEQRIAEKRLALESQRLANAMQQVRQYQDSVTAAPVIRSISPYYAYPAPYVYPQRYRQRDYPGRAAGGYDFRVSANINRASPFLSNRGSRPVSHRGSPAPRPSF